MKYLIRVQANHGCWIADIDGDPGRTTIKGTAEVFANKLLANIRLELLTVKYPTRAFEVEEFNKKRRR